MKHAILAAEECGKTDKVVAKLYNINQSTVFCICKSFNETKAVYREPTQDRPRKTTEDKIQQNLKPPRRFLISPIISENRYLESFSCDIFRQKAIYP